MWCIWREINDRSIEECERLVVDLKAFFFKPFTNGQLRVIVFALLDIMIFLIFFLYLIRCFSCILPVYLGCALLFLIKILITNQKQMWPEQINSQFLHFSKLFSEPKSLFKTLPNQPLHFGNGFFHDEKYLVNCVSVIIY
jgi:hypothetical protein